MFLWYFGTIGIIPIVPVQYIINNTLLFIFCHTNVPYYLLYTLIGVMINLVQRSMLNEKEYLKLIIFMIQNFQLVLAADLSPKDLESFFVSWSK